MRGITLTNTLQCAEWRYCRNTHIAPLLPSIFTSAPVFFFLFIYLFIYFGGGLFFHPSSTATTRLRSVMHQPCSYTSHNPTSMAVLSQIPGFASRSLKNFSLSCRLRSLPRFFIYLFIFSNSQPKNEMDPCGTLQVKFLHPLLPSPPPKKKKKKTGGKEAHFLQYPRLKWEYRAIIADDPTKTAINLYFFNRISLSADESRASCKYAANRLLLIS